MQLDAIIGYGFKVEPLDENHIIRFFESVKHQATLRVGYPCMQAYADCYYTDEDAENHFSCYEGPDGNTGLIGLITDIIRIETGIDVSAVYDEDTDTHYILMSYTSPWVYNAIEKTLTEKEFIDEMSKYVDELGLDPDISQHTIIFNC